MRDSGRALPQVETSGRVEMFLLRGGNEGGIGLRGVSGVD